jgi:hypothetical protein
VNAAPKRAIQGKQKTAVFAAPRSIVTKNIVHRPRYLHWSKRSRSRGLSPGSSGTASSVRVVREEPGAETAQAESSSSLNEYLCSLCALASAARATRKRELRGEQTEYVGAVVVVVADVLLAESEQVGLVQLDHVIQHFPAYALDPSFGDAVCQRLRIPVRTAFNPQSFGNASTSPLNSLSRSNTT